MLSTFNVDSTKGNDDNIQPRSQNDEGTITSFHLADKCYSDLDTSCYDNNEEENNSDAEDVLISDFT